VILAVCVVQSEPVSVEIPRNREKYSEFQRPIPPVFAITASEPTTPNWEILPNLKDGFRKQTGKYSQPNSESLCAQQRQTHLRPLPAVVPALDGFACAWLPVQVMAPAREGIVLVTGSHGNDVGALHDGYTI
jgi:hypothetical protein